MVLCNATLVLDVIICKALWIKRPILDILSPHSRVVRASARSAGGRGSIPDRVTPKTLKIGGLRFSAWRLALMS